MAYQESAGRALVGSIAPKILFLSDPEAAFEQIDAENLLTEEQRIERKRGALLQIMLVSAMSGKDWANYYRAIDFVRKNDWFWKELGFDSFDNYWKAQTGEAFQAWSELEGMYNFAKIACPKMFTMTREEAFLLYGELARLRSAAPMGPHGTNRHTKIFDTKDEAILRIAQASSYRNVSSGSLERRYARIRRDKPELAAKILQGEYLKETESGKISIDIGKAETEIYGQPKRTTRAPVKTLNEKIQLLLKDVTTADDAKALIKELSLNPLFEPYLKKLT